ncbi:MAG: N6-L-threonylcarbamoyladenine synthase [Kiritimatiellia bacterium]|jgi:N6-L-threonylcarbamoyladenine synthase
MNILGIETSCDETAAAVVRDGRDVRSNVVLTQIAQHRPFGGVVPEIACRAHLEALPGVIDAALEEANTTWSEIDAIAVTRGPGLASSLLIGVSAAKGLARALNKPLLPVNHLEGHVFSVFLGNEVAIADACPLLLLLVTGGHTCLILMDAVGEYRLLASTCDDAAGEALDKGAKLMGLGYPGGPEVEKAALDGNPKAISFPIGFKRHEKETLGFSFSGLKTSLRYHLENHPDQLRDGGLADVAASYQEAVMDALVMQLERAMKQVEVRAFACVGGVAKNQYLRQRLDDLSTKTGLPLMLTPMQYCTDNAAMIAAIAGARPHDPADMALDVKPTWPL